MAVFWFGWTKKLKNIFTKKEADTLYLQKNSNQLQTVSGLVDFQNNVVCKRNGYVDYVDTNSPTSMINKRYLEEQTLSKTSIETIISSGTSVKYQNLAKINENIFDDTATYDFTKPIYVSFTRYNNNVNMGSWTGTIMYSQDRTYWLVATNIYRSNSSQNMEIGQYVGLFITRSFIQIQCWDPNDRISDIVIKAHLR